MIIREMIEGDIVDIATLHKASRRMSETGVIFESDLDRDDLNHFINNWKNWFNDSDIFKQVAIRDNKIVGFTMYGRVKTRPSQDKGVVPKYGGEIYAIYVDPDYFRQGIGQTLFKSACDDLTSKKLTSMILWALKKNKTACAFYASFGGEKIAKQRVDMGEKSWGEESCFAWRDITIFI